MSRGNAGIFITKIQELSLPEPSVEWMVMLLFPPLETKNVKCNFSPSFLINFSEENPVYTWTHTNSCTTY
jgi:hypothetical protein